MNLISEEMDEAYCDGKEHLRLEATEEAQTKGKASNQEVILQQAVWT